jgi:lysophospholipase L1-like esterase
MLIEKNKKLLFIGDSITDCGRSRDAWNNLSNEALGHGYVKLAVGWLQALYPDRNLHFNNQGISGNTILDLKQRWRTDVIDPQPDWLSVMIGINDVWRQFDRPYIAQDQQVSPEVFAKTYSELLDKVRADLQGLVIASPFFLEPNRDEPMRQRMDAYTEIAQKMAENYDAIFINTQAAFDHYLQKAHYMTLAADRVHPNVAGHTLIAREYLKVLEAFPYGMR